eukprot:CAMPEP_0176488440 /NCGR_PEP_ID=MMETSP0200_2-20121128/6710_1 /TAXON_ID=947934 /ORGANISM="Chaetoceros sp., Strain GSL56" /LENGTH=531 /DNA_ID=CAMNT_0017885423 /DNA_START=217 /DNA_END=1812 /DNA_ORIENTATION=-
MAYAYWKTKRHEEHAVFELFFRKNPFQGSYTVFCGIDEVLKYVSNFCFTTEDIAYLESIPSLSHCEPEFFQYLLQLDCSQVKIQSVEQGSIVFPRVPLFIVSGPILVAQLLETTLLNLINYPSLVATNASRMVLAARGQFSNIKIRGKIPKCIEFGARRAQGPDGAFSASKYCIVGGFDAVANVQAGKLLGLPVGGTHAHSFVMSFQSLDEVKGLTVENVCKGSINKNHHGDMVNLLEIVMKYRMDNGWESTNDGELAAFIAYAVSFPTSFLCLVDTYDTIQSGVKNFILVALALIELGYSPKGIRLDSGDLSVLSLQSHEMFCEIGNKYNLEKIFDNLDIVASNDINEEALHELNKTNHGITVYGIGTNLVTCQAQPALGCVYKLVELNGQPRIKVSDDLEKVLIPGKKRAFRLFDEKLMPTVDLLIEEGDDEEPVVGEEISVYHPFSQNNPRKITPSIVKEIIQTVWDEHKKVTVDIPDLIEARETCINGIRGLHPSMVKIKNPMQYDVCVSKKLYEELHSLWESHRKA